MTPEEEIANLKRIVGNHSVMLHALKEKVQYIANLRSSSDSAKFQIYEIVSGLQEWADECDEMFIQQAKERFPNEGRNAREAGDSGTFEDQS